MKPSRHDIVELLQRGADASTPPIDPVFVEQLDRRLRSIDLSKTVPRRRRVGRVSLVAVAVITATAGVAAAAAGVITRHNSPTRPPTTEPVTTVEVTTPESNPLPSTSVAAPVTSVSATTTSTAVTTTTITTTTSTLTVAPTTVPATAAPPSTEVRVPATLTLACTPAGAAISCSWDAGPAGTTHYALLRTDSASSQGRVFTPEPGSTTYIDTLVAPGTTYVYLVHALDDTEHSVAHSDSTPTACCG